MHSLIRPTWLSLATASSLSLIVSVSPLQPAFAQKSETTTASKKPNFVTIVIDDMGYSDLGAFGSQNTTPNLDALLNNGIRLTNFYSAPTSTPARAMFFTGRNNHRAGIGNMPGYTLLRPIQVGKPGYDSVMPKDLHTFPEILQTNGYHTIMTGKWDLCGEEGIEPGQDASDRGFTNTLVLLPGGDVQYLSDDKGKLITSQPPIYYKRLGRNSPYSKNGQEFTAFPPNAYSTEFYTNSAIEFLDQWVKDGKSKPFFLNVSHIATHSPYQSPEDLTQKYLPIYSKGWDVIRAERFAKQKELGLVPADAKLLPRNDEVGPWDKLTPEQQQVEARRMAVYAGMTEMLDRSVGVLVQHLKDIGEYDSTVFFVFSDNGAATQESGSPAKQKYNASLFTKDNYEHLSNMGSASSFIPASPGLGMVSNTPLNRYKAETFEGGIHTMAFVSYPKVTKGGRYDCVTSGMDIGPTILELAGIPYPAGEEPMDGVSMASIFTAAGATTACPDRSFSLEMDGNIIVRKGDWKIGQRYDVKHGRWDSKIYLFNIKDDLSEQNNLSWDFPDKFQELMAIYQAYADKNKVIPVGYRTFANGAVLDVFSNLNQPVSDSLITGGVQVNYDYVRTHTTEATAKVGDIVDIAAEIYPSAAHLGQKGQVLVVAYSAPDDGPPSYIAFSGYDHSGSTFGMSKWDGSDLAAIPAYMDFTGEYYQPGLPRLIQIPIYEGEVNTPGTFQFWVGYRMEDGTLVSNSTKTISLTVTPK